MLSTAIRSKGDIVLNVASSGITSLLLPNRRTVYSRFKISISINESSTCNIKQNSAHAKLINKAKLIIWDESLMVTKFCFEAPDRCLKDILRYSENYNSSLPFEEKVVVLGGDFKQIVPVIPKGSRQDIVHATINSSYLWSYCKVFKLTKNLRFSVGSTELTHVEEFSKWLLNVGDGIGGDSNEGESQIEIPDDMLISNSEYSFDELVDFVYPHLLANMTDLDYFKERTILCPTFEVVDRGEE
ncbi:hypothetical protein Cni_G06320 [Canna indica]|uniref:ATP-dependent DNA helicase n=1 Tax=Canna indica TaxID=4628 RepID=A0AAQ3Q683_9LILI|nr:hypothetical protein Cni_G06320 [Canna indica]